MAIEDILRALDDQADAERADIEQRAQVEADTIITEAREQAARIRDQRMDRVKSVVEPKAQTIVNAARLANKRDLEAARAAAVSDVFDKAGERLSGLRSDSAKYESVMRGLIEEAVSDANGDSVLQVDPADRELAAALTQRLNVSCTLEAAQIPYGGVTVLSGGGRVARKNTLRDRLELVRAGSSSAVAEILFG